MLARTTASRLTIAWHCRPACALRMMDGAHFRPWPKDPSRYRPCSAPPLRAGARRLNMAKREGYIYRRTGVTRAELHVLLGPDATGWAWTPAFMYTRGANRDDDL